jgi:hypothetical protein
MNGYLDHVIDHCSTEDKRIHQQHSIFTSVCVDGGTLYLDGPTRYPSMIPISSSTLQGIIDSSDMLVCYIDLSLYTLKDTAKESISMIGEEYTNYHWNNILSGLLRHHITRSGYDSMTIPYYNGAPDKWERVSTFLKLLDSPHFDEEFKKYRSINQYPEPVEGESEVFRNHLIFTYGRR